MEMAMGGAISNSLDCILSPKACLYTGIHKALVHSRGEKL